MGLYRFFSLLAVFMGFGGSVFLAKGIIGLSPKAMLHSSSRYGAYAFHTAEIKSMSKNKANTLVGIIYILIAFLIQLIAIIFVENEIATFKTRWAGFWCGFFMFCFLSIIFYLLNINIYHNTKLTIGKIAIKDFCFYRFSEKKKIDSANAKSLVTMCRELIDFYKGDNETLINFVKRVAKYVDWEIQEEMDFSEIDNEHNTNS